MSRDRQTEYTSRRDRGMRCLRRCAVDEVGLTETLVEAGYLDPRVAHDWGEVERATARLLAYMIRLADDE